MLETHLALLLENQSQVELNIDLFTLFYIRARARTFVLGLCFSKKILYIPIYGFDNLSFNNFRKYCS